ncbi:MAG: formate dehydrogenase subunit alpha [Acidimicrobiia bacterium]
MEAADVVVLWGSNARETHPIFFHHVLRAVRRGARLIVVDPRRSQSAAFADLWLPLDVGSDIALANAVAHEIIAAGLVHEDFVARATVGYAAFAESVAEWTPERAESITGVPAAAIRSLAHQYARAEHAQLCWTLGITEHHNAVDNVLALINLALLTGHVGRWGSGLSPLRGQNNVQGGGDMGALPNRLPGFEDLTDPRARARVEGVWGAPVPAEPGMHLTAMFEAMADRTLRAVYVLGENPAQSEADSQRARHLLGGLDHLVVQDLFLTRTAELAHVVLPATAAWCEADGTVTSSERRVQRVRAAVRPPEGARDDLAILAAVSARLGHDWGTPDAEGVWDELRRVSPLHAGMSYARLDAHGGLQWPCPSETEVGPPFLHGRLWADDPAARGMPAAFSGVEWVPPVDELTPEFPIRLTTGRRLDSYNTGVQSRRLRSPLRFGETVDLSPDDVARLGLAEGQRVRITSRRGSVVAPVRIDPGLRAGLAFMTPHFPDDVDTNTLTIEASDPRSGTSAFKASAIRVEPLG